MAPLISSLAPLMDVTVSTETLFYAEIATPPRYDKVGTEIGTETLGRLRPGVLSFCSSPTTQCVHLLAVQWQGGWAVRPFSCRPCGGANANGPKFCFNNPNLSNLPNPPLYQGWGQIRRRRGPVFRVRQYPKPAAEVPRGARRSAQTAGLRPIAPAHPAGARVAVRRGPSRQHLPYPAVGYTDFDINSTPPFSSLASANAATTACPCRAVCIALLDATC